MFLFPRKRRKINILSVAVIILGIAGAAGTVFRVVGNPDAAQSLIVRNHCGVSGCNIHDHSGSLCGSVRFCDAGIQCVGSCGDSSA